jgi:hypothetical protein
MMNRGEATRQINAILRHLEVDNGLHVDGIALRRQEVTRIESAGVEYAVTVGIELVRLPGHEWLT